MASVIDAQTCSECLQPATELMPTAGQGKVCRICADAYYVACAGCHALVATDESVARDGSRLCPECARSSAVKTGVEVPQDSEISPLVTEYLKLQAEEKRVKARMEQIKELLKAAAALRPRVSGGVQLAGDGGTVRCSYSTSIKCDDEKVAGLEPLLGAERFGTLFERKVKFSANRESLEEFLADDADQEVRAALLEAVKIDESVRLTATPAKKESTETA